MLTRNQIKIFAILFMLIDHAGLFLLDNNLICRAIGRLSFPLFVFLLVDGYRRTRNVSKYARRLVLCWVISIVPYSLAFYKTLVSPAQNIFASLFIYLSLFCVLDSRCHVYVKTGIAIIVMCLATQLQLEYAGYGVLIAIIMFYHKDDAQTETFISIFLASAAFGASTNQIVSIYLAASFSAFFLPVVSDSEETPRPGPALSVVTYLFYPVHLMFFAVCTM